MDSEPRVPKTDWIVFWGLAFVVSLWVTWAFVGFVVFKIKPEEVTSSLESAGSFGDLFGALNALFTAVAFVAVWWTGRMQKRELEFQREELHLQREELRHTREELARTAVAQEQQLAHARESSERELRAYVNVVSVTCNWSGNRNDGILIVTTLRNFGQTPAYGLSPSFAPAFGLTESDLPQVPPSDHSVGVLSPGAIIHIENRVPFEDEMLPLLARNERSLFARGNLTYSDAFGKLRSLSFAVSAVGSHAVGRDPQLMASCNTGNDAD